MTDAAAHGEHPPSRSSRGLGPAFRSLWTATACSAVGTGMTVTALPLVAAARDESPVVLGVVGAAGLAPGVLLALPTGLIADRYDRKRLLIGADVARALVLVVAAVLAITDALGPIALATVAFLIGAGETIYLGSVQALVPAVVANEHLDTANGRLGAAEDTAREFIGPPLGSSLYKVAPWLPFVGDAASYVFSAFLLVRMPSPPHEPPADKVEIGPAWRCLRASQSLQVVGLALVVLAASGSSVLAILVLIVTDDLGIDDVWFGPFLTALALGSTAAGVSAGRIRSRISARVSMTVAVAVNAGSYMVLGTTHLWLVAVVVMFTWGFSVTYGVVTSMGIRQRLIPLELLGRAMGLFRTGMGVGAVVGALGGGYLATQTSPATVALVAGLVQLPVVALVLGGLEDESVIGPPPVQS